MTESDTLMPFRPEDRLIYHITDIANLPGILGEGGLLSDAVMSKRDPTVIGHNHIKDCRAGTTRESPAARWSSIASVSAVACAGCTHAIATEASGTKRRFTSGRVRLQSGPQPPRVRI